MVAKKAGGVPTSHSAFRMLSRDVKNATGVARARRVSCVSSYPILKEEIAARPEDFAARNVDK